MRSTTSSVLSVYHCNNLIVTAITLAQALAITTQTILETIATVPLMQCIITNAVLMYRWVWIPQTALLAIQHKTRQTFPVVEFIFNRRNHFQIVQCKIKALIHMSIHPPHIQHHTPA